MKCFIVVIGVAQAAQDIQGAQVMQISKTETISLFQYIQPVLQQLTSLLSLYHNYQQIVQLILELLFECTNEEILWNLLEVKIFLIILFCYKVCTVTINVHITFYVFYNFRLKLYIKYLTFVQV